jgi:hypothetical protein
MKVTLNLPDAPPELLDLAVSYLGRESRADLLRHIVMEMLEVVREDAIPGADGECIGSVSASEAELFPERWHRTTKQDREGETWKDGEPEGA